MTSEIESRFSVIEVHYRSSQNLVKGLPSYLQYTPDLLRNIEEFKNTEIPNGAYQFPWVLHLWPFSNIPHQEGVHCLEEVIIHFSSKKIDNKILK